MQCPKCGHIRTAQANNPAWQCPACGIAYKKYRARLQQTTQALKPLTADAAHPRAAADGSAWTLIGANIVTLGIAYVQGWSMAEIMLIYWAQSIIIGASYVSRIASLEKFSTENFRINNKPVEPSAKTKRDTVFFFLIHFGIFNAAHLAFILQDAPAGLVFDPGFILCTIAFAINHSYSYRYHRDLDRQGTPNIGTLMFTPYLRIVPMHLTIIAGATFAGGAALLLFGLLKTIADVLMHTVEHKRLGHKLLEQQE